MAAAAPWQQAPPAAPAVPPLFQTDTPLVFQLTTDLRALLRDRGAERPERPGLLHLANAADSTMLEVELRTRGIFRLKHCTFPPLRLDLPRTKTEGTPFAGQDKLKLVTHCRGDRSFDRLVLREYALYRAFAALTDSSLRTRVARVTYVDSARADTVRRVAFLIEAEEDLARRIGAEVMELGNVHDMLTEAAYMTLVAVFQYMIGNTDWSVWGRHNITILRDTAGTGRLLAVPYDFDFSGAVNAPYATPPPQLPIRTVRERLYRGYCQADTVLNDVLARFRGAKDRIYAAVRETPGLDPRDVRDLLAYFDDFYATLDNPGALRRDIVRRCRRLEG